MSLEDKNHSLPIAEETEETKAGNYFVSNYPPFSFWTPDQTPVVHEKLDEAPQPDTNLGLYVHIPFCRKRCHFCYFKVYTDKNSDDIRDYMDAVIDELAIYARKRFVAGRKPKFIYFGGGTPSYLSAKQLTYLFEGLQRSLPWDAAEEVAFECEPGTLNAAKLKTIRDMGVTRLSLGIEHFDDHVLELNGRAHRSKQVYAAYGWAKDAGFPQINIDLIAGMLGETEQMWQRNIDEVLRLKPDAVTIYQMEVPFNTGIYKQMKEEGKITAPVADWPTKRRWVNDAFTALEAEGYTVGSAYTAVRDAERTKFVYRDALWQGADMLAVGVSSFGHVGGVHYQNQADIVPYISTVATGGSPIYRAYPVNEEELLVREWVLQLKLGEVSRRPFIEKFGVDPFERWSDILGRYEREGLLSIEGDRVVLTREALLQVDRLLHAFFLPEHRDIRYA